MFGVALDWDEWVGLAGIVLLSLRITYGITRLIKHYIADAPLSMYILNLMSDAKYLWPIAGIAGGAMAVSFVSIEAGAAQRNLGSAIYVPTAFGGFFLGLMLEFTLGWRLYRLSFRLASFRVPQYRERLQSADPAVRLFAAGQLACLGIRALPARTELLEAMRDKSADVRAASAMATLYANPDPPPEDDRDTPATARVALTDPDVRVRGFAAAILVKFRAAPVRDVLPALTEGLGNNDIAHMAATMLAQLGPEAAPAIPALREGVLQKKPAILGAIGALGAIGRAAVPALIEILEIGDLGAKWEAVDVLGKMGGAARDALPALRRLIVFAGVISILARKAIRRIERDRSELR